MPLKLACAQIEVLPGRPDVNSRKMLDWIARAKQEGVDVILFPEMAIPGYMIGDRWEQPTFLDDCVHYGQEILAASQGITVIFGNVAVEKRRTNTDGHVRKYNAAFVAQDGRFL
ncbi:MAG: nitrilase-related carbon-nitrogen hydrolase, partial [Succiniclasticum sp.]|nr:nitrilase-related carbon-nitrogen hydrolase [Succiniclasticum sp.]